MPWAIRRQIFYVFIIVVFLSVLGFLIISPYINKVPSCADNKKNGDETGVDCGGACSRACAFLVEKISVLWARSFLVIPGRYNAVAYLENRNRNAVINKIKYRFDFYDKNNIYIAKREGSAFIPARGKFAIFEAGVGVGNSVPVYTKFQFTEAPVWNTVSEEKINQLRILVSDVNLQDEDTHPRLSAIIKNYSLYSISDIGVVVILYDKDANAISASRTHIDSLRGEESKNINFTWLEPIIGNVITKEIIPMYNIFLVNLR